MWALQVANYGSYHSRLEVNRNERIQAAHRSIQRADGKLGGIDFQDAIMARVSQKKGALLCGCKGRVIKVGYRVLRLIEQIQEADGLRGHSRVRDKNQLGVASAAQHQVTIRSQPERVRIALGSWLIGKSR